MHISAKVDYGLRALLELSASYDADPEALLTADTIAERQGLPVKFLEGILRQLRGEGIVVAKRGAVGGYRLALPPREIALADVVRHLDGPLADIHGERPEDTEYLGPAEHLIDVWVALRAAMRDVLESTSLHDVQRGRLNPTVRRLLDRPDAWVRRIS